MTNGFELLKFNYFVAKVVFFDKLTGEAKLIKLE